MTPRDPYRALGVSPRASDAEIKAAWRARLQDCHPDRAAADGPEAMAAAEAETKAVNAAYREIKDQRKAGISQPPAAARRARPTRVRRRPAQPDLPVDARDALRRAQVAVGYADTLCGQWRNHAASIRQARQQVTEASKTATRAAERCAEGRLAAVGERDALAASMDAAADELTHPARRAAEEAEQAAERAAAAPDARARASASAAVHTQARLVERRRPPADALARRADGIWQTARRRVVSAEGAVTGLDRQTRIAGSAAKRGRDAQNRARRAFSGLKQSVDKAGRAVDRAAVAAGLAGGICAGDLESAQDEHDRFVARRAIAEAERYQAAARKLARDQQQVVDALGLVPERRAEITALAEGAGRAAQQARQDADIARAAVAELTAITAQVAAELMTRIEARMAGAVGRAEVARGQVDGLG